MMDKGKHSTKGNIKLITLLVISSYVFVFYRSSRNNYISTSSMIRCGFLKFDKFYNSLF